jgi:hypothetical protein
MRISRKRIYKILNSSKQTQKKTKGKLRKSASNGGKRKTRANRHGKTNLRYRTLKRQKGGVVEKIPPGEGGETENPLTSMAADPIVVPKSSENASVSIVDCIDWKDAVTVYGFNNLFNTEENTAIANESVLAMCTFDEENFETFQMPPDGNCGWYSILQWLQNTGEKYPNYYNELDIELKQVCGLSGDIKCPPENLTGDEKLPLREYKSDVDMELYTAQWKPFVDKLRKYIRENIRQLNVAPDNETKEEESTRIAELNDQYLRDSDLSYVAQTLNMTVVTYNDRETELNNWTYFVPANKLLAQGIYTSVKLQDNTMYPMPLILKSQPNYYSSQDGVQAGGHFDVFEAKNLNEDSYKPIFRNQMYQGFIESMQKGDRTKASEVAQVAQKDTKDPTLIKQPNTDAASVSSLDPQYPNVEQIQSITNENEVPQSKPATATGDPSATITAEQPESAEQPEQSESVEQVVPVEKPEKQDSSVSTSTVSRQLPDGRMEFTIKVIVPNNASTSVNGPGGDNMESTLKSFLKSTTESGDSVDNENQSEASETPSVNNKKSNETSETPSVDNENQSEASETPSVDNEKPNRDSAVNPTSKEEYQKKLGTETTMKIIGSDKGDLNANNTKKFMKVMKTAEDAYKEIKQAASSQPEKIEKILTPIVGEILKKLYPTDVELIDKATIDGKISQELKEQLGTKKVIRDSLLPGTDEELEKEIQGLMLGLLEEDETTKKSCADLTSEQKKSLLDFDSRDPELDEKISKIDPANMQCALDIYTKVFPENDVIRRKIEDRQKQINQENMSRGLSEGPSNVNTTTSE